MGSATDIDRLIGTYTDSREEEISTSLASASSKAEF
jgi:hypothetical protein